MERSCDGPLSGIRVIDIGTMVAGPVAATLLADLGAEVIKVEQPENRDTLRHIGPHGENGDSLWWNVEARNKRSITLDLQHPEGQRILKELVKDADVVVENFRPGTLERWNLGWKDFEQVNPRLVMLSVSGFGQTGPYAPRAGYDRMALALGGMLNISGYPDRPPVRPGTAVADCQSALFGAFGIMVALYNRDALGGQGQQIDLSLYESVFRFTDVMVTAYDKLGVVRERTGNIHFAAAPGDHFETADGRYVAFAISSDRMYRRLCDLMPQLLEDELFATRTDAVANVDACKSCRRGVDQVLARAGALPDVRRQGACVCPHLLDRGHRRGSPVRGARFHRHGGQPAARAAEDASAATSVQRHASPARAARPRAGSRTRTMYCAISWASPPNRSPQLASPASSSSDRQCQRSPEC